MSTRISAILDKIAHMEKELEEEILREAEEKRQQFRYRLEKEKVFFDRESREIHRAMRQGIWAFLKETPLKSLLVAPVIYSLFLPLILLDLWIGLYQAICFQAYGIRKVDRKRYISLDRGKLPYLNRIEQINCDYCGYANGLMNFAREVASRTEQYFCPIKHVRRVSGAPSRYHDFCDFGDGGCYRDRLTAFRKNTEA